jgi:serine/threonine protein phosphatase PrpC
MKLQWYEQSEQGARHNNQDYYAHFTANAGSCFVVADGLGGHQHGEVASKIFCGSLIKLIPDYDFSQKPTVNMAKLIENSAEQMRTAIIAQYGSIDTATTFALAWVDEHQLLTAHVGDSRVYRINPKGIVWRTPDHTLVQELFEQGKITEADFAYHPLQNRLLKTVNIFEAPDPTIYSQPPLQSDEGLLLCTDGFWAHVVEEDFVNLLKADNPKECLDQIIKRILDQNPVTDNITVQFVKST